jgi:hypothetical protein
MEMGPLDCLVVEFPGNRFSGEILPALHAVVEKGLVRIADLTFIRKDESGRVSALELTDLGEDDMKLFNPLSPEVSGLLSAEDVAKVADALNNNSSAALLLFEHLWSANVREAIERANGRLVLHERIPASVVEAALADASQVEVTTSTASEMAEPVGASR